MRKTIFFIVLASFLSQITPSFSQVIRIPRFESYKRLPETVFGKVGVLRLFDRNTSKSLGEGTAFLISNCHILTNAHVASALGKRQPHTLKYSFYYGHNPKAKYLKKNSSDFTKIQFELEKKATKSALGFLVRGREIINDIIKRKGEKFLFSGYPPIQSMREDGSFSDYSVLLELHNTSVISNVSKKTRVLHSFSRSYVVYLSFLWAQHPQRFEIADKKLLNQFRVALKAWKPYFGKLFNSAQNSSNFIFRSKKNFSQYFAGSTNAELVAMGKFLGRKGTEEKVLAAINDGSVTSTIEIDLLEIQIEWEGSGDWALFRLQDCIGKKYGYIALKSPKDNVADSKPFILGHPVGYSYSRVYKTNACRFATYYRDSPSWSGECLGQKGMSGGPLVSKEIKTGRYIVIGLYASTASFESKRPIDIYTEYQAYKKSNKYIFYPGINAIFAPFNSASSMSFITESKCKTYERFVKEESKNWKNIEPGLIKTWKEMRRSAERGEGGDPSLMTKPSMPSYSQQVYYQECKPSSKGPRIEFVLSCIKRTDPSLMFELRKANKELSWTVEGLHDFDARWDESIFDQCEGKAMQKD